MKQIHKHEKEQFKKLFDQNFIDRFEDRFKILEVFLQTERHVTVSDMMKLLEKRGYDFPTDMVLGTLKLIHRYGFAEKNRFNNGEVQFEHRHLGQHHDHMICTKCKSIIEFTDNQIEKLQIHVAANYGFHMLQHKLELYGICSNCIQDRALQIPLSMAKPGEQLTIKAFNGVSNERMRLFSMGLQLGDSIEVISNQGLGQVVISIGQKRYAFGRSMAQKIMVESEKDHRTNTISTAKM